MIESILLQSALCAVACVVGAVASWAVAGRRQRKEGSAYERKRVQLIVDIRMEAKRKGKRTKIDPVATVAQLQKKYDALCKVMPVVKVPVVPAPALVPPAVAPAPLPPPGSQHSNVLGGDDEG